MKLRSQTISLNPIKKLTTEDHDVRKNTIIGVFGESGCGKTSFLKYLYHSQRNHETTAYMKQDILLHPELTIYETLWFYTLLRRKEECSHIENVLIKMNMNNLCHSKIGETKGLSGGEKKRILIAYHLLDQTTDFFLMDEPFSGIDPHNTELIFYLMKEKTQQQNCAIIFTAHQLPFHIHQLLDEKWTFFRLPDETSHFQLEVAVLSPRDPDTCLTTINLEPDDMFVQPTSTTMYPHVASAQEQWKYLFLRDRILDKRNKWGVFLRWTTPLFVILLQQIFIGSFPKYLKDWGKTDNVLDLSKAVIMHTILLFTVSMIPMHMLNDHFYKRAIIQHEISQGIYRKNAYFFSAILWDQISLILISLCITLIVMPPDNLFLITFFNIIMEMNFTNMLMWVCSSFPGSTFNTTLILVSTYISIAFIGNMGMLLRSNSMDCLQYISITHIQSNLFLENLFDRFPQRKSQLDFIASCLNIHYRIRDWSWILLGLGLWAILPVIMTLIQSFVLR